VSATRNVILRDGFANLSLDAVAAEADLSKPSLFYYFATREALAHAVMLDINLKEVAAIRSRIDQSSTVGQQSGAVDSENVVDAIVRAYVDFYLPILELFRASQVWALTLAPPEDGYTTINAAMIELFDCVEAMFKADKDAGLTYPDVHPRRAAVTIWNSAGGLMATVALLDGVETEFLHRVDDMVDELCAVLRRGIYRGQA
jgi:AcrR family transcriptional regulator